MSAVSLREKRLVIATVLVILYAIIGFTARKRLDNWKLLRVEAAATKNELQLRNATIDARPDWEQRYLDVRHLMPQFLQYRL